VLLVESGFPTTSRIQKPVLITAWLLCALLLSRFALDFSAEEPLLAVPFWGLALSALAVMGMNILPHPVPWHARATRHHHSLRALLLAFIPVGFLASTLDCTGLSVRGCSPFCTFIKLIWIPLIAIGCLVHYLTRDRHGPTVLLLMSFVPLVPHCICYNVANAWWIGHIGVSPECYVWGFVVSALALASLYSARRYLVTVAICAAIIAGSFSFFVGHHYFRFPW
jgi:hypothetical protein